MILLNNPFTDKHHTPPLKSIAGTQEEGHHKENHYQKDYHQKDHQEGYH